MRAWGHGSPSRERNLRRRLAERSRSRDGDPRGEAHTRGSRPGDVNIAELGSPGFRRHYGVMRAWTEEWGSFSAPRDQVRNASRHSAIQGRQHRYTGRERFEEGHDDRAGGDFAEYYTPTRQPYTHRERWGEGHDDRDGWRYCDHAPSVRPFTDPNGFSRCWNGR
eukprot:CAMPEP_0179149418 /NCGR_PEP_ID=MMETSP0796-20121207/72384_1 /TAXON_ID=73915 /ORGANISM="Pyrodinium bahamense, Strain pbaha01" /LENGTH=164 /DNA_ID=CAMNT_0020850257 /DNA_START=1 /DNA_END=495 /DNA_ORIENTATION=-